MTQTKDVILKLKEVKNERGLSLDRIMELIEENDEFVSKSTLSRVFAKGSENKLFRYETTLRPIANALLDIETIEEDDDADIKAYKSILKLKMAVIEENSKRISELQDTLQEYKETADAKINKEKMKYHKKLEEETLRFQRSINFAKDQIELKDKRIDQLMEMNHQLMSRLLTCPCREDCK